MPKRLDLPAVVYLRTSPTLHVGEAYSALGITRGRAYQLRQRNGFPSAVRGMIDSTRLAHWLVQRGGCRICWN